MADVTITADVEETAEYVTERDPVALAKIDEINEQIDTLQNEYGTSHLGSGGQCLAGLVPAGHPTYQANTFLKVDGTWAYPTRSVVGTFTVSGSPGRATVEIPFIPKTIKIWSQADGTLCNILVCAGVGATTFTVYDGGGTRSVDGTCTTTDTALTWKIMASSGSYVYEAQNGI